jgi:hypothetical protein
MVNEDKVRAFYFHDGTLTIRESKTSTQGKNWFFLKSDLEALEKPRRGRPEKKDTS